MNLMVTCEFVLISASNCNSDGFGNEIVAELLLDEVLEEYE